MNRRKELEELLEKEDIELLGEVLDQIVFLEGKLTELKELPFIEVHPKNPCKQRNTPASKMYKEFLQQYINCIKLIENVIYKNQRLEGDEVEESPLRKWFREHDNTAKNNLDT